MKALRDQRGAALVEFSLVLPLFLLVVGAVFSMLWMMTVRSSVTGAARDGVRFASIPACCPAEYPDAEEVEAYVRDRASFEVNDVEVVVPERTNDVVSVTVSADLPVLFRAFGALLGNSDLTFETTAKARAE
jgi:Flp pilus assembly pilin Flp